MHETQANTNLFHFIIGVAVEVVRSRIRPADHQPIDGPHERPTDRPSGQANDRLTESYKMYFSTEFYVFQVIVITGENKS